MHKVTGRALEPLQVLESFFNDLCRLYLGRSSVVRSLQKDLSTAKRRLRHEGISFLTISLPNFLEAFLSGLEHQVFTPPMGFHVRGGSLPVFLQGLTSLVFDTDGVLRSDASADDVKNIIQTLGLFGKLKQLPKDLRAAERDYVQTDMSCLDIRHPLPKIFYDLKEKVQGILKGVSIETLHPSHGPGVVADSPKERKFSFPHLYLDLNRVFPMKEWHFYTGGSESQALYLKACLSPRRYGTCKVIFIPKNGKKPRTIAAEPSAFMWIQQAVKDVLYDFISYRSKLKGKVDFFNQEINQRRAGAMKGDRPEYATIDLSSASDRLSNELVQFLFQDTVLADALSVLRSEVALLPSGKEIRVKKFCSQGNALCFPIQSIVFSAIASLVTSDFSVFGDDIIVPNSDAEHVMEHLRTFGLVVNQEKSFWRGDFRESCGSWYFKGINVTPLRVRYLRPTSHSEIVGLVELSNHLFDECLYSTGRQFESLIGSYLGEIPRHGTGKAYLSYGSARWRTIYPCGRWDSNLHDFKTKQWALTTSNRRSSNFPESHLFRQLASSKDYHDQPMDKRSFPPVLRRRWVAS